MTPSTEGTRGTTWTREEVAAAVASYMQMLTLHLTGQRHDKTSFRKRLLTQLRGRSKGAIEKKHQNISAALLDLGCMFLPGYAPLTNYQSILLDEVAAYLARDSAFDAAAREASVRPAVPLEGIDFEGVQIDAPRLHLRAALATALGDRIRHVRRDYLLREANNRALGEAGERFVLDFERYRLRRIGREDLSSRVEHVARTRGDGLGYDVLSHDPATGMEVFIEVKTTAFGAATPFYVTENERQVALERAPSYRVCRVFEFRDRPRLYELPGRFEDHFALDPATYMARLA